MSRSALAIWMLAGAMAAAMSQPAAGQTCPERAALAACMAPAPAPGETFSGPVLQVIDGGALCVALGPLPSQWVRVRLADAAGGEAAAFAQKVACVVTGEDAGGAIAICVTGGVSVGALAQAPAVQAQAASWQ